MCFFRPSLCNLIWAGLLILVFVPNGNVAAQAYALGDSSTLWIDGTSSVNSFTCHATEMRGTGVLKGRNAIASAQSAAESPALITVDVPALDCGNRRMNRDLQKALKTDDFPTIAFQLKWAERVRSVTVSHPPDTATAGMPVQIVGTLTLAGHSREVVVLMMAEALGDGRFRGTGHKDLKMTDFGVRPPTALFGLVKARDEITIVFDLVAVPE